MKNDLFVKVLITGGKEFQATAPLKRIDKRPDGPGRKGTIKIFVTEPRVVLSTETIGENIIVKFGLIDG